MSNTEKRTLNNDKIAQAIADATSNIIANDICSAVEDPVKSLVSASITSEDGIPCNFTPNTSDVSAATEPFDYDAHIARHDSRIGSVVSKTTEVSGDNWKEAGPCHV